MKKLRFKKPLLLTTYLITGGILAPLTLNIATSPAFGASLGLSQGKLEISNLSHNPISTRTLTNSEELVNSLVTTPFNDVIAGGSSVEPAQSQARVSNFSVQAGEKFSFDFATDLNVSTSIDDATDSISASGYTAFFLVDVNQQKVQDSFFLSGNLTTPGPQDSVFFQKSDNIALNQTVVSDNFDDKQEFVTASLKGSLNRTFNDSTALALIEAKVNRPGGAGFEASPNSSVAVPESSNSIVALLLGGIGISYRASRKRLAHQTISK